MTFRGPYDVDSLDKSVLVLQDKHQFHARADVEVHARVTYGSSYSPICDLILLLWYVLHRTHHTRLGPHHESG